MNVMFFHGLESGPHGRKFRALQEKFPDIESPDFRGMRDVPTRMALAVSATEGKGPLLLVGSSFGGLCAALLAQRLPERVAGLLLLAPALHWGEASEIVRVPNPTAIVHGVLDEVVPISHSEEFVMRFGDVPLLGVEDGHRLEETRGIIAELAVQMHSDIASSEA